MARTPATVSGSLSEGVSSDGSSGPTVYAQAFIGSDIFEPITFIEVHSLSFAFAQQLPQGGSRVGCVPFKWVLVKPQGCGRFSSPLRNPEDLTLHHSTDDTPSVSCADSSLREGAGRGAYHSNGCLRNPQGCGRFSSPLRNAEDLTSHHSTVSGGGVPPDEHVKKYIKGETFPWI